ncbi:Lrp/AsnC family transcriptional regulator [Candidatus Woesearchaeota archaeon]|nr:Lrp/AsnC family transcriptional regulator [Candidatus Woesearchaeota archaeon]
MNGNLDKKDELILEAIKHNARASTRDLSKIIGLPITTIHTRLKRLEKEKIITEYTTKIDHTKTGRPILTYIFLTVDSSNFKTLNQPQLKQKILKLIHAEEVYMITGHFDILIKIYIKDTKDLSYIIETLRRLEGVHSTQTMVVLE